MTWTLWINWLGLSFMIFWQLFLYNYLYTIYQYKCTIRYVLSYWNLYLHFGCKFSEEEHLVMFNLKSNKSLIMYVHTEYLSTTASRTSVNYLINYIKDKNKTRQ